MPMQTKKSGLFAKYGNKLDTAVQKHAADETNYGIQPLPPGITNGVAKLVECKFDTYKSGNNVGEYYFRAAGVVLEPEEVSLANGTTQKVAGLQTSIMIPVCDTKNQKGEVTHQEEHIDRILNEMRKLAGDEFTQGASGADLEDLATSLKEAAPYFRFRTSQSPATTQFPNPRIWENWDGAKGLESYEPPEGGGVEDNSEPVTTETPAGEFNEFQGQEPESEPDPVEPEDLDALAVSAKEDDEGAITRLGEIAEEVGIPTEAVEKAPSWEAVISLIRKARDKAAAPATKGKAKAEPAPEPTAEWKPDKGDVYFYKPLDPKTKKPVKKAIEVEVKSVDLRFKTVTALNSDDRKTLYKDVAWASLEGSQS